MSIIKISDENYEKEILHDKGTVLVDFYADWCGPCKSMTPIIEKISQELDGKIKIGKVNVDENQGLAMEYGVMSIPTFIVFKNGEIVKTMVGARSEEELLKNLK